MFGSGMFGKGLGMALGGGIGNQGGGFGAPGAGRMTTARSFSPGGFAMGRPGMSSMGNSLGSALGGRGMFGGGMGGMGGAAAGAMSPTMGAGLAALSDRDSKKRIDELEGELSRTYAALSGPSATGGLSSQIGNRQRAEGLGLGGPGGYEATQLDEAYRRPTSNSYEYRNPEAPGAAPGRQAGPMADELRGLPGVVNTGPDGMQRVDTGRLTMTNASEIANLRREMDALMGRVQGGQSNPDGTF